MSFIFETQTVGGLSFSIWEDSSGQFFALISDPDCQWQSQPVATIAEAEKLAREMIVNELLMISQTVAEMAAAVLAN
ncbi:MAG TPA: hypothetical protein V6D29_01640 [Leptolyngbyaceae cyanobacterium]